MACLLDLTKTSLYNNQIVFQIFLVIVFVDNWISLQAVHIGGDSHCLSLVGKLRRNLTVICSSSGYRHVAVCLSHVQKAGRMNPCHEECEKLPDAPSLIFPPGQEVQLGQGSQHQSKARECRGCVSHLPVCLDHRLSDKSKVTQHLELSYQPVFFFQYSLTVRLVSASPVELEFEVWGLICLTL